MTEVDNEIGNISAREVNSKYGEVKKMTTQQLYRNYKAWMEKNNPGAPIMPFKHWIRWAKEKGVVKSFGADASGAEADERVTKIVSRSGKGVAIVMIVLGVGFLALNFVNFSSIINSNNNNNQIKK